jgi:hypothetical protein
VFSYVLIIADELSKYGELVILCVTGSMHLFISMRLTKSYVSGSSRFMKDLEVVVLNYNETHKVNFCRIFTLERLRSYTYMYREV